jgi:hypothetical protein
MAIAACFAFQREISLSVLWGFFDSIDPSETFKLAGSSGQGFTSMIMCALGRRAIMDVVVWLRSLGVERYEAAFRDNEIDERVLPSLTQEDLKEIGVGPVGHRRINVIILKWDASKWGDLGHSFCRFGIDRQSSEISGNRRRI